MGQIIYLTFIFINHLDRLLKNVAFHAKIINFIFASREANCTFNKKKVKVPLPLSLNWNFHRLHLFNLQLQQHIWSRLQQRAFPLTPTQNETTNPKSCTAAHPHICSSTLDRYRPRSNPSAPCVCHTVVTAAATGEMSGAAALHAPCLRPWQESLD